MKSSNFINLIRRKRFACVLVMVLALMGLVHNQSPAAYAENMPDIGNFVWQDLNQNGIQDAGEPGIPYIGLNVYDVGGNLIGTTLTDANGMYLFQGLPVGTFTVEIYVPAGYNLSPLGSGTTTDSDFDPATNLSAPITVTIPGDYDIDAGLFVDEGTIVHCDGNAFEVTDWTDTFVLPTYDPALGSLYSVEISGYAGINQDIAFESIDNAPTSVTANGSGTVTMTLPNGAPFGSALSQTINENLSAYDGVTDFAGSSGADYDDVIDSAFASGPYPNPSDFIGGPGVNVSVPAVAVGDVVFTGAGNLISEIHTEATGSVCVAYRYGAPGIEIIKLAGDAPDGDVEYIDEAGNVTFTYEVTNTGDSYLSDIVITDDAGTPGDPSDDFTITSEDCLGLAGPLAPGDMVTCTSDMVVTEDTTCVAGVSGNPTDEDGNDYPDLDEPTDEDDAVVELVNPDIEIIKLAGDAPDGGVEYIGGAENVTFTYEVTNTGDTYLSDIVITDDAGTPGDPSDDFTITSADCPALAGPLAPGDMVTCTADMVVTEDTTCVAGVSGNPTDGNGNDLPSLEDPTDADDAVVELVNPDIDLVKTAGTAPDGDMLVLDNPGNVLFAYTVVNRGDTYLTDITITDDAGTPNNPSDDITITSAQCGALAGPVAPGGEVICLFIMPVGPEFLGSVYLNVADTSGNPTDANGNDLPGLEDPIADDDATVELPEPTAINLSHSGSNSVSGLSGIVAGFAGLMLLLTGIAVTRSRRDW